MLLRADLNHRTLLGRAIGPGVATGLRVTNKGNGVLAVSAGLAINRCGETVVLPDDVELSVNSARGPALRRPRATCSSTAVRNRRRGTPRTCSC